MALKISIGFDGLVLIIEPEKAQALIEALAHGEVYSKRYDYMKQKHTFEKMPTKPELMFVDDSDLQDEPDIVQKLRDEKTASDNRWVEYYNKSKELQRAVDELEAKLEKYAEIAEG